MTEEHLILELKGRGMKEVHIEQGNYRPLTRKWMESRVVQNGGSILMYNDNIKIVVGEAFGSLVRVWLHNGNEFMLAYNTDDIDFFSERFDKIMEAITSPHYFIVMKTTEFHYANGVRSIPAPIVEFPFIDGIETKGISIN